MGGPVVDLLNKYIIESEYWPDLTKARNVNKKSRFKRLDLSYPIYNSGRKWPATTYGVLHFLKFL
jgi:cAMP phosphodiesterase